MPAPLLTREQLNALDRYAARHGRCWKACLSDQWESGIYDREDNSAALQTIRNTLGPSWLVKFHFPRDRSRFLNACSD